MSKLDLLSPVVLPGQSLEAFVAWFAQQRRAAERLGPGELMSRSVAISPAAARWLLDNCNAGNRPVRQAKVSEFAAKIRAGRWRLTSQGISISKSGRLNNGQHRLLAIIDADVGVDLYVTFNEDPTAFDVLDTGSPRGSGDVLHIIGHKNANYLASSARLLLNIEGTLTANARIPNDDIATFVAQRPLLTDAVLVGKRVATKFQCSAAAPIVAVYLITMGSSRVGRLTEFVDRLIDGAGLSARNPILVLRDELQKKGIDAHIRGGNMRQVATAAAMINAWNTWVHGRKASGASIRWNLGDTFPDVE